jgi:hypothetical protein
MTGDAAPTHARFDGVAYSTPPEAAIAPPVPGNSQDFLTRSQMDLFFLPRVKWKSRFSIYDSAAVDDCWRGKTTITVATVGILYRPTALSNELTTPL